MLCIVSDKNLRGLCAAIDRPDMLEDERFIRGQRLLHMREFIHEVEKWSSTRELPECEDLLNRHGVPYSRYNAPADLFEQPQLLHRGAFHKMTDDDGDYLIQNAPFQFDSFNNETSSDYAQAGQHTDWILENELDLDKTKIEALRQEGIIE